MSTGQGLPVGGYAQQVTPGYQQQQQYVTTTMGDSLHLFGGHAALQTKNPFAAASMRGMQYGGMEANSGATFQPQPLFNSGGNGTETSLLGSGFLDGLFDDKATKNPFAT